jgi:hypothetical protein
VHLARGRPERCDLPCQHITSWASREHFSQNESQKATIKQRKLHAWKVSGCSKIGHQGHAWTSAAYTVPGLFPLPSAARCDTASHESKQEHDGRPAWAYTPVRASSSGVLRGHREEGHLSIRGPVGEVGSRQRQHEWIERGARDGWIGLEGVSA